MRTDILVLGAGIVGVSVALHLQQRGRAVVLADRRGPCEETSYGNAGIIQREGIVPYAFPRDPEKILRTALNQLPEAHIDWRALPALAPWLWAYWRHGSPARVAATASAARPLIERSIAEHEALMQAAGISALLRRTGYLKVFRSPELFAAGCRLEQAASEAYGVMYEVKDARAVHELEPHLDGALAGGILMPQPASVTDPAAVGKGYAALFSRRGGKLHTADARTLEAAAEGWLVRTVEGPIEARDAVVALGPWMDEVTRRLGLSLPLAVKRGYHMHYRARGNAMLNRPIFDAEGGYVLAPMQRGLRVTTGAEFAPRDAPPSPVQLDRVEPLARALFPLADRIEPKPWLGSRPCFPDLLPMLGAVPGKPGLWLAAGHHHLGFTLGPVTARLLAEMMTGEAAFTDPWPYRVDRFH